MKVLHTFADVVNPRINLSATVNTEPQTSKDNLLMLILITLFAAGILLGWIFRKIRKLEKISGKLTFAAIALLLFLLGLGVGTREEVRSHLDSLGLTGLLIAIFSIAGSILFAWITWKVFYRKHEG